jgi:hypothetical protein
MTSHDGASRSADIYIAFTVAPGYILGYAGASRRRASLFREMSLQLRRCIVTGAAGSAA